MSIFYILASIIALIILFISGIFTGFAGGESALATEEVSDTVREIFESLYPGSLFEPTKSSSNFSYFDNEGNIQYLPLDGYNESVGIAYTYNSYKKLEKLANDNNITVITIPRNMSSNQLERYIVSRLIDALKLDSQVLQDRNITYLP